MGTKGHQRHHDYDNASHSGHHHHSVIMDDSPFAAAAVKRIKLAFYLNSGFALIEWIGGILIGSFAIVADAIHDFGDSMSLALALALQKNPGKGANE